jgi:hypothetical protein
MRHGADVSDEADPTYAGVDPSTGLLRLDAIVIAQCAR